MSVERGHDREAVDERMDAVLAQLGEFFMGDSPLHRAAEQIARLLREAGIEYAVAGALGMAHHGYVRATEDVDILITRRGLEQFKKEWLGRGYANLRTGGKPVRDTVNGVKIDFLIAGDFPGDGKPKPVALPPPAQAAIEGVRYRVLSLTKLVEIKIASGLTAPHRIGDLADVIGLVRAARLPRTFADGLDPSVRAKFEELWEGAQHEDEY